MSTDVSHPSGNVIVVGKVLAGLAVLPCSLLIAGGVKHFARGGPLLPGSSDLWLRVHLLAVIPSLPLGAYVLLTPKGGDRHRLLGRIWIALMLAVALSSYGLRDEGGRIGFIHLLAIALLIGLPIGLYQAVRGR